MKPTSFEKMRANRRLWTQSRVDRLLARIDKLEAELAQEWRDAPTQVSIQPGPRPYSPARRRLFGWLVP